MDIIYILISAIMMSLGFIIQIKKLKLARMTKEITWELEVYICVVCIIHYSFAVVSDVVHYACPTVNDSIASFFHHLNLFIRLMGIHIILCHSLNIAIYKYYIIVFKKPINRDDAFMEKRYISILIIVPILMAIGQYFKINGNIANTGLEDRLCVTEEIVPYENTSFKDVMFCPFKEDEKWTIIYIITESYCFAQFIFTMFLSFNIFEGFIYHKIFSFAKR